MEKNKKLEPIKISFETMAMNFSWGLAAQVPYSSISWEVNNANSKVISWHETFKKTYKKGFLFKSGKAGRQLTSFALLWDKNLCNILLFCVFKLHALLNTRANLIISGK
jgi:hypothetical protein